MKRIRVTAIVGGVVLAASLLGACSKGSSSSSTTTAADKTSTTTAQAATSSTMAGTNFEQFQDPSGKVQCAGGLNPGAFVGSNVVCESASEGKSFFVSLNSDGTIVKTSGWQPNKALPTLPAGSTSILGAADGSGIYCVAAADGITCKAQNGKGFTITATSLTYVGGAVAAS